MAKNQDRQDAQISSGSHKINAALKHAPQSRTILDFEPVLLNDIPTVTEDQALTEDQAPAEDLTPTQEKSTEAMTVLCSVCA